MKVENAVMPNEKQMEEFLEEGHDKPIFMVNLLKFKDKIISKLSFVIIDRIPDTEIISPEIWYLLVFSILKRKHRRMIIAGIAVLKREAFITWVCTNDK